MVNAIKQAASRVKSMVYKSLPGNAGVLLRARKQQRLYRSIHGVPTARCGHPLDGQLIVSLTSYPPRFPTLHLTLQSLLDQTMRPDLIVLSIAHADEGFLTNATRALIGHGIELRTVEDVKSYKKLVFAIQEWPNAYIVTADDDNFYVPDWLEELARGFDRDAPSIVCHRAHRFPNGADVAPYRSWEWDVQDDAARHPSGDLVPTGLGGIMYPPGSLHPDVTRSELYADLCPNADDLWFYWCARRAGTLYRKVGGKFPLLYWESTQDERLFNSNTTQNDAQIARLVERYGNPLTMNERTAI